MSRIAGSPLGLVGLESKSNGNFDNYNNRTRKSGKGNVSLFSGDRIVRPFAIGVGGESPSSDVDFDNKKTTLHSDDLYNTTINNIVDKLKGTKAELSFLDFAYLKDVGVYPNNRLMIARRFATPQLDNIMYNSEDDKPLVTLISWKPVGEDFIDISFGEEWTPVTDGSFTSIINEVGKDFKIKGLGGYLEEGGGLIPLPGSTETLQRRLLAKIGILDNTEENINQIPEGNPNLIKEAKMRKMVAAGSPGSGLSCGIKISMECVWEQKYIQGIDPTLAWMDILSMVTRFGTSTSQSYGLSKGLSNKIQDLLRNPDTLIKKTIDALKEGIGDIIKSVKDALGLKKSGGEELSEEEIKDKKKKKEEEEADSIIDKAIGKLNGVITDISNTLVRKYRERILGVINILTGLPSTPWHITIGNPLRPIFCSGDMLTTNVQLKLGSDLSFNDLPTTIKASFTLENARPLGLQEIMAKFNSGYLRVLSYRQDDKGRLDRQENLDFSLVQDKGTTIDGDKVDLTLTKSEINSGLSSNNSSPTIPTVNAVSFLPVDDNVSINPDPNSTLPIT